MTLVARAQVVRLLLVGWLAIVAGCSPRRAPAGPTRLRVVVSPSLVPLIELLRQEYAAQEPLALLQVSEGSLRQGLEAVATRQADLAFVERLPEWPELLDPEYGRPCLRAWTVAADQIAVVVHPSNPVQSLSREQLSRAFQGLEHRWLDLGGADESLQLVTREPGAAVRTAFEEAVVAGKRLAGSAVVMPSDAAVAGYVTEHPQAIGYISLAWLRDGIKVVAIDGTVPGAGTERVYPLIHPLAIVGRAGPPAKVRAFVAFVLSRTGQEVVGRRYARVGGS